MSQEMFKEIGRIVRDGKGALHKRLLVIVFHILLLPIYPILLLYRPLWRKPQAITKLLLIRMDGIGDLAMTAAIFPALRNQFPDAQIDLLTSKEASGIAEFFLRAKWLNNVHVMPLLHRSMLGYWKLGKQFRAQHYDAAIDLRGDMRNIVLMVASHIPVRIGMSATGLTYLLTDVEETSGPRHQSEQASAMVRRLGVQISDLHPRLPLQPEDRAAAETWLTEHGAIDGRPIFAFHLGAFYPSKVWPLDRFVGVAKRLQERYQAHLVVVGGPKEAELAAQFAKALSPVPVTVAAGTTSLRLTAALLARCAIFIGNDSGPSHIAAGVQCPVLVLFGPSSPVGYRPLGRKVTIIKSATPCDPRCSQSCVRGDSRCMLEYSVDAVAQAAENLLL